MAQMHTLMRVSSSSSPRMASCRCRGVIRFTCMAVTRGQSPIVMLQSAAVNNSMVLASVTIKLGLAVEGAAAHLEILGSISSKFQHLCSEILCKIGRAVS